MSKYPAGRVRTLAAADFLGDPARNLGLASRYFGHEADPADIQPMLDAQVMRTNAKEQSAPYGIDQRQAEMDGIRSRHERELTEAMAWVERWAEALEVSEFMRSHRLVGG